LLEAGFYRQQAKIRKNPCPLASTLKQENRRCGATRVYEQSLVVSSCASL